jgi:hypothetical protein
MHADEIAVGMSVRYPRTGTTGTVTRIDVIEGETFALVDTTGLLYRADVLIPGGGEKKEKRTVHTREDELKSLEKEKLGSSGDMERAVGDVTGVGAG